jgi:hypothetical protein
VASKARAKWNDRTPRVILWQCCQRRTRSRDMALELQYEVHSWFIFQGPPSFLIITEWNLTTNRLKNTEFLLSFQLYLCLQCEPLRTSPCRFYRNIKGSPRKILNIKTQVENLRTESNNKTNIIWEAYANIKSKGGKENWQETNWHRLSASWVDMMIGVSHWCLFWHRLSIQEAKCTISVILKNNGHKLLRNDIYHFQRWKTGEFKWKTTQGN